ncbi:hypothetical protein CERZMDRAFT_90138 [Cercospora zeae-maydis SCOH1-5]|uniref:Uncharacterized protein n=1 Tax=Cercospora zeae-maydis SCOH1-5 TaxID=717836 RepID=A0A6A6FPW4_9PEZI|nr:hypothetical protein CERZMDRAFT_90138 [Cercospora zeae-maydis SCOH1-5]
MRLPMPDVGLAYPATTHPYNHILRSDTDVERHDEDMNIRMPRLKRPDDGSTPHDLAISG